MVITETGLTLIVAAAMIGLSRMPKKGYSTPAAIGTPNRIVDKSEKQVLANVAHGRPAQFAGANNSARSRFTSARQCLLPVTMHELATVTWPADSKKLVAGRTLLHIEKSSNPIAAS